MRENNNHAHSTATSVHNIKLTVSTKHFCEEKKIVRQKSTFMNYAGLKNQILACKEIALASSRSARGASCSPPASFTSVCPLADELVLVFYTPLF